MEQKSFGRYVIQGSIGKGGMATILRAQDPLFGRDVALKVLPREFLHDPSFRGRFEREARTIASLEHPAIVPVYDFGEDHGQPFIVMRFMRGGSLADRIQNGPMSVKEAGHVLERIGAALDYAHYKGIVHRDLKPGNILFDDYGDSFLADFGIVKVAEASATLTGAGIVGTPAYMSPEQIHGDKEVDGRSDIYALGVILFEMLTGQMPYRADTPAKLMMAHVLNPTPRILDVRPDLPPACNTTISLAMAKDRDERFATAGEMARALTGTNERASPTLAAPGAATVVEALPAGVQSAAQAPPPVASHRVASPASPISTGGGRSRILVPIVGGIGALLCCGVLFVAFLQFGGLEQLGLAGELTTATLAVVEQSGTLDAGTPASSAEADVPDVVATEVAMAMAATDLAASATAVVVAAATQESASAATADAVREEVQQAEATANAAESATAEAISATEAAQGELSASEALTLMAVEQIQQGDRLFGPTSGVMTHIEDGFIETVYAGVDMADFVAQATFSVPYSRFEGNWDVGFMFRDVDVNDQFRLVIDSDGFWSLSNQLGDDYSVVGEGELDRLNTAVGDVNVVLLMAEGDAGYLIVNDTLVTRLDLSERTVAGDIAIAIGLFEGDEIDGAETVYEAFSIWPNPQ